MKAGTWATIGTGDFSTDRIVETSSIIPTNVEPNDYRSETCSPQSTISIAEMKELLTNVRDVAELAEKTKVFEVGGDGFVYCIPCKKLDAGSGGALKTNEVDGSISSYHFSELKSKMIYHLYHTEGHKKAANLDGYLKSPTHEKNYVAGKIACREVYSLISEKGSYTDFEKQMLKKKMDGAAIGDINNSIHFAKEMVPHIYSSLLVFMKNDLNRDLPGTNRPSPLSLVADKATPTSSTLHIIGLVSLMNGKLTPLVLNVVEARDNTGSGLVHDMIESAQQIVPI